MRGAGGGSACRRCHSARRGRGSKATVTACLSVVLAASLLLPAAAVRAQVAGSTTTTPRITQVIDDSKRVTIAGSAHPLSAALDLGAVSDDLVLEHILFMLDRSADQERGLQQFVDGQHDPASPYYHAWLTAAQVGERFGPARDDVERVAAWLRSHGFAVNRVHANATILDITGTAGQVRAAFNTEIHRYLLDGSIETANATPVEIPRALAAVARGPSSLSSIRPHRLAGHSQAAKFTQTSTTGAVLHYLSPADLSTVYATRPLWDAGITGKGSIVAVVGQANFLPGDWTTFMTTFGLTQYAGTLGTLHPACSDPGVPPSASLSVEELALDVDLVSAIAPGASIQAATCAPTASTDAIVAAVAGLVDQANPPDIISVSYGICEAKETTNYQQMIGRLWQQAAAEGISIVVATGDAGAAECDDGTQAATLGITVSVFAATPYNVAVGATDFSAEFDGTVSQYWSSTNTPLFGSVLSYVPERAWNFSCASTLSLRAQRDGTMGGAAWCNSGNADAFVGVHFGRAGASSGGPSSIYAKPSWQANVFGIANDGHRDIPDVSMFGGSDDNTYVLFCNSDTAHGGAPCDYANPSNTFDNASAGTSVTAIDGRRLIFPKFCSSLRQSTRKADATVRRPGARMAP